jgi:hypothetical protein
VLRRGRDDFLERATISYQHDGVHDVAPARAERKKRCGSRA